MAANQDQSLGRGPTRGLALGYGPVSAVLTVLIIGFVGFLALTGKDVTGLPGTGSRGGKYRAPPRRRAS